MTMREDFLSEVKKGDEIRISAGHLIYKGIVLSMTDTSVQLKAGDTNPRVNLEKIDVYEIINSGLADNTINETKQPFLDEFHSIHAELLNPTPVKIIPLSAIKKHITNVKDSDLRNKLTRILDMLTYAVKIGEANPGNDRVARSIVMIDDLFSDSVNDTTVSLLKAYALYLNEKNEEAADCFMTSHIYESAIFLSKDEKKLRKCAIMELLEGKFSKKSLSIIYLMKNEALPVWNEFLMSGSDDKDKDKDKELFRAAFASYFSFGKERDNMLWPDPTNFLDVENMQYLKNKLSSEDVKNEIMEELLQIRMEPSEEDEIKVIESNKVYLGTINYVNNERQFGMIGYVEPSNDAYFRYDGNLSFPFSAVKDTDLSKQIISKSVLTTKKYCFFNLGKDKTGYVATNLRSASVQSPTKIKSPFPQHTQNVLQLYNSVTAIIAIKNVTNPQLDNAAKKMQTLLDRDKELYAIKKLESTISLWVSTNMRLDRLDDAIKIIEKYYNDSRVAHDRLLSLHIQVLERRKGDGDKNELLRLYNEIIGYTPSQAARLNYMIRNANLLQSMRRYEEAIKLYLQWQRSTVGTSVNITFNNSVKQGLSICYYNLGRKEQAKALAKELLKINADNDIAKSILDDTFSNEENLFPEYDQNELLDDQYDDLTDNQFVQSELFGRRKYKMTEFAIKKRDELDIDSLTKSTSIELGSFTGTPQQARKIISALKYASRKAVTPLSKMQSFLGASKIIDLVLTGKFEEDLLKEYKLSRNYEALYVGNGMAAYGDYMAQDLTATNDTVTFIYHNALVILSDMADKFEEWTNSFNRCLYSYFDDRQGMREYVRQGKKEEHPNNEILKNKDSAYPLREFLIGIIFLLKAINKTTWYKTLLNDLYDSPLREKVFAELLSLGISTPPDLPPSLEQFTKNFEKAIFDLEQTYSDLDKELDSCVKNTFSDLRRAEIIIKLQQEYFQRWICDVDRMRLNEIVKIQEMVDNYRNSNIFEDRAYVLSQLVSRIDALCEQIVKYPTYLSYEVFLQRLYRQKEIVDNEQVRLYEEYPPELTISLSDNSSYKEDDGMVRFHLSIHNQAGRQAADNINISVEDSAVLSYINKYDGQIRGIKGGTAGEKIIYFQLQQRFLQEKVCDVTVNITYEYNSLNTEPAPVHLSSVFTLNLYNKDEFTTVPNRYTGMVGNPMTNKDMFFGREELINKLVSQIKGEDGSFNKGHAVALFGQTRAGKSSILYHCKNKIREKYKEEAIIVDCGSVGEIEDLEHFLSIIIDRLILELEDYHTHLYHSLKEMMENYKGKILNDRANIQFHFGAFFTRFNAFLEKQTSKKIIVLMIDEFTYFHKWIKDGKISPDFMKMWKAIMQNYGVFAIVVGQDNMPVFKKENQNEFSAMKLEQVTYLDRESAIRLMSEPILYNKETRYRQGALDRLFELTAGSPFLILILCDKLVDHLNDTKSIYITRALIDEFIREKILCQKGAIDEGTFESQINDRAKTEIYEKNRKILLSLARAQRINGEAEFSAVKCADIPEEEGKANIIERLIERNVVSVRENRYYSITVGILGEWLLFHYGKEG
jgi:preprotein translocase subunit YajC